MAGIIELTGVLIFTSVAGTPVINGDFEDGDSGFTSEYTFAATNTDEGQYTVALDPAAWNGGLASFGDHTTGNGLMMIVNGATKANVVVWSQTISVQPNSVNVFSVWVASAHPVSPARLQLAVDGELVGPVLEAIEEVGEWVQFQVEWLAGSQPSVEIALVNQNTAVFANDFALDDITVTPGSLCLADFVSSDTFQPPPDGTVDAADLAFLLGEWGRNPGSLADIVTSATFAPPPDGFVDAADLAFLLGAWGACE
jgi:hypothetical protein